MNTIGVAAIWRSFYTLQTTKQVEKVAIFCPSKSCTGFSCRYVFHIYVYNTGEKRLGMSPGLDPFPVITRNNSY